MYNETNTHKYYVRICRVSDSVFLHALDTDPVSSFSGFGTGFSPDPVPGTKKKSAEKALKVIY